jgi:hypothetical protein
MGKAPAVARAIILRLRPLCRLEPCGGVERERSNPLRGHRGASARESRLAPPRKPPSQRRHPVPAGSPSRDRVRRCLAQVTRPEEPPDDGSKSYDINN